MKESPNVQEAVYDVVGGRARRCSRAVCLHAQEPVTIKWLEWWGARIRRRRHEQLTSRFEAETGIRVERTTVNWDSMYDLLLTNAQAGTATYDVLGMEACCFLHRALTSSAGWKT